MLLLGCCFFSVSPVAICGKQMLIFFVSSWEQCINLSRLGLISLWRLSSREESQRPVVSAGAPNWHVYVQVTKPFSGCSNYDGGKGGCMGGWKKKKNPILSILTPEMASDQKTPLSVIESMDQQPILFFCFGAKSWVTFYLSTFRPVLWVFFHAYAPAIEAERIHVLGLPVRLYILPYNSETPWRNAFKHPLEPEDELIRFCRFKDRGHRDPTSVPFSRTRCHRERFEGVS